MWRQSRGAVQESFTTKPLIPTPCVMKIFWLVVCVLTLCGNSQSQFCGGDSGRRTPCAGTSADECANYGCCWDASQEPSCFFQTPVYYVKEKTNTDYGLTMTLAIKDESTSGKLPGSPISPLQVDITEETEYRLHVKVTDPNQQRWEIPESMLPPPSPPAKPISYPYYKYQFPEVGEAFYFAVSRLFFNETTPVFNTSSMSFIYANQLLQIGTSLSPFARIYGFGEHKTSLLLNDKEQTLTLWNYDGGTPSKLNLYGSHPFYLGLEKGGGFHGVFVRNSNGMDVHVSPDSLKYSIIGGVLDFYFFLGPSADNVIFQYYQVIGRPAMPPYWALGFHQCRWGYKNLQQVKDVVQNYAKNQIPLDSMWTDIDYMDGYKDFTTDPVNFPTFSMREFIDELHSNGQHYVVIIDPAISSTTREYTPYEEGISMDIFIKDRKDDVFIGKVWPGYTAYPDFAYPLTTEYWTKQISNFLAQVPVDGLWIDMNEPSNMCDGACSDTGTAKNTSRVSLNFDPVNPPYVIGNRRSAGSLQSSPLNQRTLDMDAKHHSGISAYNMHNLYGFTESMATKQALLAIRQGKRPFILSRSTFAGSGAYAAHWLGDNSASVEDLKGSVTTILNLQMLGITLVGADICGFNGDTTEELCARWMELGSFYPFARNHNTLKARSQEPYLWSSVANVSRKYLAIRYSLLPYYYTLFHEASLSRYPSTTSVLRPLFYDFQDDTSAKSDMEFLVGHGLLVAPQLNLGFEGKEMDVYLPADTWYDWYTHQRLSNGSESKVLTKVQTPLDHVPMYIRGGNIIPIQAPGLTTAESRKNPYSLIVALRFGKADGGLYLDDGESYNASEHSFISYSCYNAELTSSVTGTNNYAAMGDVPLLQSITILGLLARPSAVALDGVPKNFTFTEGVTFKMVLTDLSIDMSKEFILNWI